MGFEERKLLGHDVAFDTDLVDHDRTPRFGLIFRQCQSSERTIRVLPEPGPFGVGDQRLEPGERAELGVAHSDGGDEAHAAELAVGNGVHPGAFLQRDSFGDGAIFGGARLGWTKVAFACGLAGFLQIRWPQQAPDHVRTCNFRHISSWCPDSNCARFSTD